MRAALVLLLLLLAPGCDQVQAHGCRCLEAGMNSTLGKAPVHLRLDVPPGSDVAACVC